VGNAAGTFQTQVTMDRTKGDCGCTIRKSVKKIVERQRGECHLPTTCIVLCLYSYFHDESTRVELILGDQ